MLNSIGLANPGRDRFLAETLPRLRELGLPLWVSVGGFSAREYAETCERLDDVTIELNLSCPNVDEAPESAAEIVAACRAATTLPLYAKLSPAAWDIAEVARAVEAAGADGLSLVNTMRGLALDERTLRPVLGTATGGYSGPALRRSRSPPSTPAAARPRLPIVGMGGVTTGRRRARARRRRCLGGRARHRALRRSGRPRARPGRARDRARPARARLARRRDRARTRATVSSSATRRLRVPRRRK